MRAIRRAPSSRRAQIRRDLGLPGSGERAADALVALLGGPSCPAFERGGLGPWGSAAKGHTDALGTVREQMEHALVDWVPRTVLLRGACASLSLCFGALRGAAGRSRLEPRRPHPTAPRSRRRGGASEHLP